MHPFESKRTLIPPSNNPYYLHLMHPKSNKSAAALQEFKFANGCYIPHWTIYFFLPISRYLCRFKYPQWHLNFLVEVRREYTDKVSRSALEILSQFKIFKSIQDYNCHCFNGYVIWNIKCIVMNWIFHKQFLFMSMHHCFKIRRTLNSYM